MFTLIVIEQVMYLLPVNVVVNSRDIRIISSFDPSMKEKAELFIPLGPDVPTELVVNTCRNVFLQENDQITTAMVLSSLINSYMFCKTTRCNTDEATEKVLLDIVDALQKLYDYKESTSEWNVVRNKRNAMTAKKWINKQLSMFFDGSKVMGDIVRNVLPYFFINGIPYNWNHVKHIFIRQMGVWTSKIKDPQRCLTLNGMVQNYLSYF